MATRIREARLQLTRIDIVKMGGFHNSKKAESFTASPNDPIRSAGRRPGKVAGGKSREIPHWTRDQYCLSDGYVSLRAKGEDPNLTELLEETLQLLKSNLQGFRQNSAFSYYTHEVGISHPTGHDVEVEVMFDARSGALAEVHAKVKSVRPVTVLKGVFALPDQIHHLGHLLWRTFRKIRQMLKRTNQEMSGRVGEYIQNNEIVFPAKKNEFLFVILG